MSRYIDAEVLCKENFMCDCLACEDCYKTQKQKIDCEYYSTYSLQDFCEWISETPTADVKPVVRGEWVDKSGAVVYPFWDRFTCSVCGKSADASPYCPNCGAMMSQECNT